MTLEALIRDQIATGKVRSLTLWTTPKGFQANASSDGKSWSVEINADPVEAIRRVLGDRKSELPDDLLV